MWRIVSFRMERPPCSNFSRHIAISKILLKSHYDVLGLTPKATQDDIKTAYYKLSMIHHPDKNKGEDTATFRDITAAYEVLGNYKLRKLYDRGLLHTAVVDHSTDVHENPEENFYQSRASRHRAPSHTGKTPIYDFDEWARQHYGQSFAKKMSAKHRWETNERAKTSQKNNIQSEINLTFLSTLVLTFIFILYSIPESYDVDRTKKKKSEISAEVNS